MSSTVGLRLARFQYARLNLGLPSTATPAPLAGKRRTPAAAAAGCPRSRFPTPSPALTRAASTATQTKPTSTTTTTTSTTPSRAPPSPVPAAPIPPSETLNPPATTRPPPLDLPARADSNSLFAYLFQLGKAYTRFYKSGLGAVLTNQRLVRASSAAKPPHLSSSATQTFPTRADVLLRQRARHDLSRLPLFGLVVLVFGELTPLVVLAVPRLTPLTCRIPRQVEAQRRGAEARRAASRRALRYVDLDFDTSEKGAKRLRRLAAGHVCRSLGLTSALWDRLGVDGPLARTRADRAVAAIARDDAMIRDGGGVGALVDDEVVLACEDRGIDVLGWDVGKLRGELKDWIRRTAPGPDMENGAAAQQQAEDKIRRLFLGLDEKR
ncbi:hypothetical protein F4779DRAFT_279772 [Xylariaceae sp. FL0662B]|nr:hypothetical protein F4779DRAFT_279772 [Xylariaceae sp. FL0662B]